MNDKGRLGRCGEDEACRHLMALGHTILERNWRVGRLEVDIISLASDGMHFVEVKSRVAPVQGEPEQAVNFAKRHNVAMAAGKYMSLKEADLSKDLEVWFDIVAVTYDGGDVRVSYFPAAFTPMFV